MSLFNFVLRELRLRRNTYQLLDVDSEIIGISNTLFENLKKYILEVDKTYTFGGARLDSVECNNYRITDNVVDARHKIVNEQLVYPFINIFNDVNIDVFHCPDPAGVNISEQTNKKLTEYLEYCINKMNELKEKSEKFFGLKMQ